MKKRDFRTLALPLSLHSLSLTVDAFAPPRYCSSYNKFFPLKKTSTPSLILRMAALGDGKFHFAVDRGGTFTDLHCRLPDGTEIVSKLLSEDPMHYPDAPNEGIRRILDKYDKDNDYSRGKPVPTSKIG